MTMKEDACGWIWALVGGWFSPTVLFVLLNIVIGTIAVTSRVHRHRDHPADHAAAEGDPRHLSRASSSSSSVLERLRSFGLYRFRSGDFPLDYTTTTTTTTSSSSAADAEEPGPDPTTANLSDAAAEEGTGRMKKSASASSAFEEARVVCRRAAAEEAEEGTGRMKKSASASSAFEEERVVWRRAAAAAEEVNARADDFINRFRQQLRLQRLNSLLNYKEMLNRG